MSPGDTTPQRKKDAPVPELPMGDRFTRLWRRQLQGAEGQDTDVVWSAVERRYSEPHRRYHDKQHLAYCLAQFDLAAAQLQHPDQVEMAIWFHDVIHDPGQPENERRSAEYFRRFAAGCMDPDFVLAVEDLIMVTTHCRQPEELDHRFICDIDLASFGCPWECFMRDSEAVKAEYPGPEEEYYRGKEAFLSAMLQRRRIFLTDFFNARYEQQARDNIQRLLEKVRQAGT
jgi:predicted metal-dependent HD superfamily phosphohydrolase